MSDLLTDLAILAVALLIVAAPSALACWIELRRRR